jgi:hypothetical protein
VLEARNGGDGGRGDLNRPIQPMGFKDGGKGGTGGLVSKNMGTSEGGLDSLLALYAVDDAEPRLHPKIALL